RIGENPFDPRKATLLTRQLCGLRESSRCHQRLPARVHRRTPAANMLRRLHLEVRAHLSAQVVLAVALIAKQAHDARERPADGSHIISVAGEHSYCQPIRRTW